MARARGVAPRARADGEAPRGDYPTLTSEMKAANITLSTIGIGSDADTALLQELAQFHTELRVALNTYSGEAGGFPK